MSGSLLLSLKRPSKKSPQNGSGLSPEQYRVLRRKPPRSKMLKFKRTVYKVLLPCRCHKRFFVLLFRRAFLCPSPCTFAVILSGPVFVRNLRLCFIHNTFPLLLFIHSTTTFVALSLPLFCLLVFSISCHHGAFMLLAPCTLPSP